MPIKRTNAGEIGYRLSLYRNGKRLKNEEGAWNLINFCRGWEIRESIDSATMEASFIFEDAAGLLNSMTGSETLKLQVQSSLVDKDYNFIIYQIHSRSRSNQGNDVFMVECVSEEYIRNETLTLFGQSDRIFKGRTEASYIIRQLLTKDAWIGSKKNLYLEETINNQQFVSPNWRPFDAIYWMAQRSVRKSQKGGALQNGFMFYENGMGYHFRSLDKLVDDINEQTMEKDTDPKTGKARMYKYYYTPKKMSGDALDIYTIDGITFPEEKNLLNVLRDGNFAGYTAGFDPVTITQSKMGLSKETSTESPAYGLDRLWSKMSHLNGKTTVNPMTQMDRKIKSAVAKPRRVRYNLLPNQSFDPKFVMNPQANMQELAELQAYQYMRIESIRNIQLVITVPGNLDLYVGCGIDVQIPATFKAGRKTQIDKKYSGKYMISKVKHSTTGHILETELRLMKDSVLR